MKKMDIEGIEVNYFDNERPFPALIFIHGNSHSSSTFSNTLNSDHLLDYRLIALDLPGHGDSEKATKESYGVNFFSRILVEFIMNLNISDYILIGHSLGGHIGIHSLNKLKAKGLFLFGTPPLMQKESFEAPFLPNQYLGLLFKAEDLSQSEEKLLAENLCFDLTAESLSILSSDFSKSDYKVREDLGRAIHRGEFEDEEDILLKSSTPIALVVGAQDKVVNANYLKRFSDISSLWNQRIYAIEGAGHNIHLDRPHEFEVLLERFVSDVYQEGGDSYLCAETITLL